jgi:hypothetical protein
MLATRDGSQAKFGSGYNILPTWKERMNAKAIIPEKLRMMLTFEGDPSSADYLLDEWPEALLAHAANPTIPVFVVSAVAAHPQASRGAGAGRSIA